MTAAETESPCDFHCGYFSSGQDLWNHVFREHIPCPECGNKPDGERGEYPVSHKPDCPRLQPGYVYPPAGSGYTYDGPLEGDDDPYVNDEIGGLT